MDVRVVDTRQPKQPHCWITQEQQRHPAIILRWEKINDRTGTYWAARVVFWLDDKPMTSLVPADRVKPLG